MKKRKILYISGTRADYGLMKETLFYLKKHPKLTLEVAATGMHLMPEFGLTINEIKKDKLKFHKVNVIFEKDNKESMSRFVGELIILLTKKVAQIKPDFILLLGDRGEMLAGAVVGVYLSIPVAQIHGGDISSTVDEITRHAITKLSHLHFSASQKSAERIIKMGEEAWRVFKVGAPGLDSILNKRLLADEVTAKKFNLDLTKPILLVAQHSAGGGQKDAASQIKKTMDVVKELKHQTVVIYPNADAGGREIIKVIKKYRHLPYIQIHKTLAHQDYLSLIKIAQVLIGNSSSGIIEAPSFLLPAVNIGPRQAGRERAGNVIDVDYNRAEIKLAVEKALHNKVFQNKIKKLQSPYGDGQSGQRIAEVLAEIEIDHKLLNKKLAY